MQVQAPGVPKTDKMDPPPPTLLNKHERDSTDWYRSRYRIRYIADPIPEAVLEVPEWVPDPVLDL